MTKFLTEYTFQGCYLTSRKQYFSYINDNNNSTKNESQCEFESRSCRGTLDTTFCDKICQ